ELVPVPVAFQDFRAAVRLVGAGTLFQHAGIGAQAHGPPLLLDLALVGHEVNDRGWPVWDEFRAVGVAEAGHVPSELDHRALHPEAQTEEGHLLLPGVADRRDLALDAPPAKAAGHDDAVHV